MKNLMLILSFGLCTTALAAPPPITGPDATTAQAVMSSIVINNGTDPNGDPAVLAKWSINYSGLIMYFCSMTKASEFLAVQGDRTLYDAFKAPTPNGSLWFWNSVGGIPAGVNQWCIQ